MADLCCLCGEKALYYVKGNKFCSFHKSTAVAAQARQNKQYQRTWLTYDARQEEFVNSKHKRRQYVCETKRLCTNCRTPIPADEDHKTCLNCRENDRIKYRNATIGR